MLEILSESFNQLVFMGCLLLLSGFFSGSETAIFSLKPKDLNKLRQSNGLIAKSILLLRSNLKSFLTTVLLCNLLVNILFFASSTVLVEKIVRVSHNQLYSLVFGIVCLVFVITFGEITPKSLATAASLSFSKAAAIPMLFMQKLLWPVRIILTKTVLFCERILKISDSRQSDIHLEELKMLIEISRSDGILSSNEQEFISSVIELPNIKAKEVMTPRIDIITLSPENNFDDVFTTMKQFGYNKIPVRDNVKDEIFGWIDTRELYIKKPRGNIRKYIKKPLYVSEFDRADIVLKRLQESNNIALVVDERGSVIGLITIWDVLSEVFGEIDKDNGEIEEEIIAESETSYVLSGRLSIREWKNVFGTTGILPSVSTLAGLFIALLGHSPKINDVVSIGNIKMQAIDISRHRINKIRLTLKLDNTR